MCAADEGQRCGYTVGVGVVGLNHTNLLLFAKRGAPPEADDYDVKAAAGMVVALHATLPPESPLGGGAAHSGSRPACCEALGVYDETAWFVAVQGLEFFNQDHRFTRDPHGGPLPSPLPDGDGFLSEAPHGGTFVTAVNRSSRFTFACSDCRTALSSCSR